ncbi:hypothetical protein [Wolbachia endosymbiont of Dirofilaria (Dirofilaria) immitis]|uniref:hypothetical protein n=1 Tax=Wolbachia endosymbiont of Dirofilaria (Dirofilaria) immitis TaxID=1812115 RepID=UPI0015892057|nr:hypothetical protein [Wolbachia endosymbiont of Dirofilaria (Dirofilaria) immitis]QKX02544.1 hypothetical protein GOY12_03255 [Wolbachia endosymbiont of Dirofilaria (Dirofilaria) immitis]
MSDKSEKGNYQVNAKITLSDGYINKKVLIENEIKFKQKREVEENKDEQKETAIISIIGNMKE